MPDQIMTAIAVALAGKTADTVFSGGKEAFTALARLIRERFGRDDKERKVLESAQNAPDDPAALDALTQELDRLASMDPEIAEKISQLRSLVAQGSVQNMVTGTVKDSTVIQTRDNYGGIHIGNT
jgi:transposase